jgi:hypothetical protein
MMKINISALFISVLIVWLNPVHAQKGEMSTTRAPLIEQSTFSQGKHLEKSKIQRKAGRVVLGIGAGLILIGAVIPRGELIADYYPARHNFDRLKTVIMTSGVITAVTSIPLFIVSNKNRRKGATVGVIIEKTQRPVCQNLVFTPIASFALKVVL